jgi:hypothetical protein
METQSSLPCSQDTTIGLYSDSSDSNPQPPTLPQNSSNPNSFFLRCSDSNIAYLSSLFLLYITVFISNYHHHHHLSNRKTHVRSVFLVVFTHLLKFSPVFPRDLSWNHCPAVCLLTTYMMQLLTLSTSFFVDFIEIYGVIKYPEDCNLL